MYAMAKTKTITNTYKQPKGYDSHKMMEIARYIKGSISYTDMAAHIGCSEKIFHDLCETGMANSPIGRHTVQRMYELASDEYSKEEVFQAAGIMDCKQESSLVKTSVHGMENSTSGKVSRGGRVPYIIKIDQYDDAFLRAIKKPIVGKTVEEGALFYGMSKRGFYDVLNKRMTFVRKQTLQNISKKLNMDEDKISAMLCERKDDIDGIPRFGSDGIPFIPKRADKLDKKVSIAKKTEVKPVVAKNLIADVKMDSGKTVITLTGDVSLEAIIQACKAVGAESMNLKL